MSGRGRLPSVRLRSAATGAEVNPRAGRGPVVVLTVHSAGCASCVEYAGRLTAVAGPVAEWDGSILVVAPEAVEAPAPLARAAAGTARVLGDPEGRLASGAAAVMVADEWGEIYFEAATGESHELPDPEEIPEWVRFIAIQCPECEGPEGPWRTIPAAGG